MQTPTERLRAMGVELPTPPNPVASYVPWVRTGSLLIVSGQIPLRDGVLLASGRTPDEVSFETAVACARQCGLNALAQAKAALGTLDAVSRVLRLGCFVNCAPGFTDQPKVANGASELMFEVFGEAGRHARAAVGASGLPLGAPVEVEAMFEIG
ncbi:MAG: RidA family protein [Phycisphaerales bacterium]|nr:MAG: RidA family protein [Phycisphaerales bacterium]